MKKKFLFVLSMFFLLGHQLWAQLPEVSTASDPKWYQIKVVGSTVDRRDRVFTNESNLIFGRPITSSASMTEINRQIWRFEKSNDGNYEIINKTGNRKLDISYAPTLNLVRLILVLSTRVPSTTWQITEKNDCFQIKATTPISDNPNGIYAFQTNNTNDRDYLIMLETSSLMNNANTYFNFVEWEDPEIKLSNDDSQTWYTIRSNKPGYEGKCVTDIVSSALPNICFGIDDYVEGDYSQQWKVVSKSTDIVNLVNKATGNVIQTSYFFDEGYCHTQSTQNVEESNGWKIEYLGGAEYQIYGKNMDGVNRYLNATHKDETPESYLSPKGTGFSWTLKKEDTTTGIDYIAKPGDWDNLFIYSENGRIFVEGVNDFTVRTLTGILVDKNSTLPFGVYLVTVNGKTKAIVNK